MDYKEREAEAKAYCDSCVVKDNQPNQKFKRGSFVKVANNLPIYMSHFECGFIGVVEYTYAQKFRGDDIKSYSLIMLNSDKKPINSIAWYEEDQLTLIDDDIKFGLEIIERYEEDLKKVKHEIF